MRLPFLEKTDGSASFLRAARAGNLEKVLEFLKTNTDINTCNANGLNALHLASKEGHVNVVRELLQRGANVDAATKKGNTALHIASLAGQEEIVKVLVQHQALVNIQSQNGFTPLYMAAQENHDSVVRFLLANNANQSLATEDGFTPLAVALQQGHDKVVAVLLENDTRGKVRLPALHIAAKKDDTKAAALLLHTDHNPDVTSKSGFTPLHIAAHYGNENIANLLIQRGADVNYIAKHQITPLHVASKWGKGNMVSLLIDKGANYEAKTRDGLTPLHCAARSGHETVVDMLLEKGAPITSKTKNGLAPLHMASQGDHVDAARILLYHKAPVDDVTVDYLTALHVAAHCGHVRVAKLLLDRKADPNARALNGFTPLHIACKKNRIKVVELLLKHGASIEATTESGLTPLHVASFMGCMNIVIYLIQHGASADVPTVRGETPLHLAARANQTDIIRILLRNGAHVDARAREQQTALHIASRLGNSDIVVLLLQHGAAVDATTKDHYTALHIAAKEGQEEVASVLLEHGASLTSTTKKGFTPLHLAAKYGNMKVARLLLQKDAPVDAQGKNGVTPLHVAAHYDHQNVALLLLDKGASPHATAKNGYTPLHIAARKNQMDIATTLLEYGASANAESKAGFTPLHLSSQEGHTDMATLLIEHNAAAGACAKNGLTPLHLCAQEDRVNVAAILVKHGAQIDPSTKAGYTPLHVACHFGQMNMVRFLLQHGAKVDSTTQLGYTPLHQAAQQGHTQIVNLLLENKAEPNTETNDGKTALSIAQRLGYISVVETLKIVTETTINTTTTTVTEEKYKVVVPETMHETFMSESEDEGGDDTMLGDQSYRYLTVDEMKSLGDDSLPIDVTKDEKMDVSFINNSMAAPPVAPADQLSPQHQKEQQYAQFTAHYPSDNVDVAKTPILAGPESLNTTLNTTIDSAMIETQIEPQIIHTKLAPQLSAQMNQESVQHIPLKQIPVQNKTDQASQGQVISGQVTSVTEKAAEILNGWEGFLVSFMVDARGGAMRGCRHSGVRVIIPPRKAAMPMRVTCRYLKKDKLVHAPPLMEGEALASRILEMGPAGAKFLGPVIIEVPHFASLRGKEREIVILRSDNGETWREHTLEATEEAVQEVLNESFDGEELKQLEDLNTNRITRILTTDFPQYFAIVTRIRQEVHAIGPEGGMVSSTVVPQVQAVFPQGALTKKIKVGLQAQPIPTDLVAKLLGNRVAVSPIVTVEPRRRKFHKPITLTIPVPQASSKGMINQYSGEAPTLRLLCSITGGTTRAQWEDVTGSTPLTHVNDCVSFTTTVSARFWLMDCSNIPEATKMATELYREAIHVPFMAKFVVFSKRHQLEEARVRVFCMTDDREDKTLEQQELFVEVAKSRDVEVLEGKPQFLEFAGNLVPVTKSGDQLAFNFYAFRENRLPFTVRVKDQHADPIGRVAFMRQPKVGRGDPPQTPICNLNIALPDNIQPEPAPSEPDLLALEKKYSFLSISKADTIHKADLRLTDISNMLGTDWVALAHELEISDSDINIIKSQYPDNAPQQAIVMLRLWMQTSGNKANGNTLEKGLRKIGRDDIVNQCIFNVELVTDDIERAMAKAHLDQSGFEAFRDELGPSRDATLNRDVSLDVSYDEQDMMKEAESAEEEEENQRAYQDKSSREERTVDMSPTYESEEKKYAGEEKVVTEEKVTREKEKDGSAITISTTSAAVKKEPSEETKLDEFIKEKVVAEPFQETKVESIIKETLAPEPDKDIKVEPTVTEHVVSEPVQETISMREEFVSKPEPQTLLEKSEKSFIVAEAEERELEKEEEQLMEQNELEKTVVKVVEKPTEIIEEVLERKESEASKVLHTIQMDEPQEIHTKTVSEIVCTPDGTPISVTTTEKKSYTTSEDGTVQEHIVVQKQTSRAVDGMEMGEDKSIILQKIGEELGRLDEKLEEKFKEKRKTDEPEVAQEEVREEEVVAKRREGPAQPTSQVVVEYSSLPTTLSATTTITTATSSITPIPDVFTQTSVESTQMSSAWGTAEVSCPGTSVTTGDEALMHLEQALIQQAAPQIVDRRIAHQDQHQQEVSLHQCSHQEQPQEKNAATEGDSPKSGQTEERGCSPITVLEARREIEQVTVRPLSRSSSHTISTTTSWGAPVSSTTSIQLSDNESAHCVQFTLHSESCVTLLAPKEMWQELGHVSQQEEQQQHEQQQDTHQTKSGGEEHNKADPTKIAITSESKQQSNEFIFWPQQGTPLKPVDFKSKKICDESERRDITNDVSDIHVPIDQESAESIVTSAETISVPRHEIRDPSNRDFTEVKGIMDQTNVDMLNSVHKHSDGEKDIASEHTSSWCKEVFTLCDVGEVAVEDPSPEGNMSEAVDISRKETEEKTLVSVLSENVATEIMQSSSRDLARTMYEIPAALSEEPVHVASEVIAPSTHRPTTLMITSNSNESTDDAECTANDPTRDDRENDVPQELKQEGSTAVMEEFEQQGVGIPQSVVMSEHLSGSESGAVPRVERPMRPAPRTATLVKVKVEKRPVGSHPQARERIVYEHQAMVHAPSVEEEVRGLMQEVKEATSQIKQEVKELRQADTPTPDTPTPLREFKEFLNREEEQEQERLPTIKEMCRESEEDASVSMGGEHMHGNEHLHLRLNVPVQECSTPLQVVQPGFDYSIHPDSGYSTLEGYNAVSVNPSQTAKYTPFFTEMVPEGFSNELSVKSELESPLSPVVSSNFCPVVNVGSATSQDSEKQDSEKHGRSRFKSLLTKVYKSTSKGLHKSESRRGDGQGEKLSVRNSVRDIADINRCRLASWETSGIVMNKDEGIQTPSYEFAVQRNAAEKKSTECQEKQLQKNGDEFYTNIVKELIKAPVKNIKNSRMKDTQTVKVGVLQSPVSESPAPITHSQHLEMPLAETSHTDSSLLEQPLTKVLNTEPSLTELPDTKQSEFKVTDTLSSTPSNTNMLFTVSPVLESQGEREFLDVGKMMDNEMFSASSCAVNLGMPGKIVMGYDDVSASKIFENQSPKNELPVTDLVAAESSRSEMVRKITNELVDIPTLKSSFGYPVTQSLTKSLPSESFITGSYILNTVTESKTDDIQENIKSKIEEKDEHTKSKLKLTPLDPYLSPQVAATDMSVSNDFKLSVKPNDAYLVVPSDVDTPMEKKGQPSFIQQDLHKVSSAGIVKSPSLEMYEDDYVELHHTDGVDVLETLIELDETEENDDLSQEEQEIHPNIKASKESKHTEEQQVEKYKTESENGSKIEVIKIGEPDLQFRRAHVESDSGTQNNEVQMLSKTNIETVTEGVVLLEKPRSDTRLFSEDELLVIPGKSDSVKTAVIEEVDSKAVIILKGVEITKKIEDLEKNYVELDEENSSYQSYIPKGLNKKDELGDRNEVGEIGYVFSYKTTYKDKPIDEGVETEGMPSPEEEFIKGTRVIEEADEPRSFDITAVTQDMSSTHFAKWLHRTVHLTEPPGEGSLASTAIHNQMEEQSDTVETADTEGKIKEEIITSKEDESCVDTARMTQDSVEKRYNSPQNKLRMNKETGKEMKTSHHIYSDSVGEGLYSEPKEIKASGLISSSEKNITTSQVDKIKELGNITSADGKSFLSEVNVKAITEDVGLFEEPKSDAKLLSGDEHSDVTEPVGLCGKAEATEADLTEEISIKEMVIPKAVGITNFDKSGENKVELDEVESTSYQAHLPKAENETDKPKENNEADETGYVLSHKPVPEGKEMAEVVKTKGKTEPEEVLVKGTRMTYKIEPRDFDTAEMTQSISSPTNVVAKQSQGTVHEKKPDEEGLSSSTVEQKHSKEQSSILAAANAEGKVEEVWLKFSSGSETEVGEGLSQIFSHVNESQTDRANMSNAPDIGEEGYNSSKNGLEMIEEIGKKMEAMQHNDSDFVKREDFVSKPKIKASELECNTEKDISTTSHIRENVLSTESDLIKRLRFATEVSQTEEFTEVGEIEELSSLEFALVKTFEKAQWSKVSEKAHTVTSTKQVWYESESDSLTDTLAAVEIHQPQECIQLENSNEVKDNDCSFHGELTNESEMDLISSEPDITVISEGEESDSWIEMNMACQSLATEYPETDKPTSRGEDPLKGAQIKLKARDIEEGQQYMLPVTESVSRTPSELDETKMVSIAMDVELFPSSDIGLILAMQNTKPLKGIEARNFNLEEKFCDGDKREALFGEPEPVQVQKLSSTLGDKRQWPSKVNVRELKTSGEFHNLDTIEKNFCHISLCDEEQKDYRILPVVEKPFPEVSVVIMDAGSDSDRKEYAESVDPSAVGKLVRSEEQMLKAKYGDTAASKTELELCDLHKDRFMQDSIWEEVLPVDSKVTENFKRILSNQKSTNVVQGYIGNRETGVNVKKANKPMNLQGNDSLHQETVIKTEAFEDLQAQQSYTFKPDDSLVEYSQGLEKQTGEVVRDRRLQCILEDETSQNFVDVTEIIKPSCELSSSEVDVRKELKDKKDLAAVNHSENEMISKLDHVSEELKTVISSLEHNLVAGTSTDVRVTSILERLEQMEQDVVNLTSTSKACESSSPVLLPDVQTDYVVSTSQASPSTEQDLVHAEKIDLGDVTYSKVKMPVGLGTDTSTLSLPYGQSPSGEINGQDVQEALTDVEDIFSDGDQSPLIKRKSLLLASQQDMGAITDMEDMDLSGEEDDIIQEKKDMPTIQDLGLLPEPVKEIINLTEGYAREASPLLLSDSEPENEDVQGRHKKNMMRVEKVSQLDLPADDVSEGLTDVEDIVASGDEEEAPTEIEDSLPDHYLDQSEGVSGKEKIKAIPPAPKIFLTKDRDSSDDEKESLRHLRHKSKESLKVEFHEGGTTDVEDLVMSDKGEIKEKPESDKVESKEKIRRKKQVRRKTVPKKSVSKTLGAPVGDSSCLTDVEILTGDEDQEALEDGNSILTVPELDSGVLTDSEDLEVSDTEVDNLIAIPVDKIVPSSIPEPQCEQIKISEVQEIAQEESGGETDEEGFELNEKDDEKPLMPRKKVIHEPLNTIVKEALDVDESCEVVYTDTEDFDIDDKEEEEVMADIASHMPKESDIYTITEMESHIGQITKREMIKDVHAELKQQIKDAELTGLTLQEALSDSALTDVEDLEDSGEFGEIEVKIDSTVKSKSEEVLTDEESVNESDFEDEVSEPPECVKRQGKRLPLVPQVSEVRFVETEQGPLSIIITPDSFENNPNQMLKDQVTNVVFLESEDKEEFATDIEELSDGEEGKTAPKLKASYKQEPATDTEDFDIDPSEVDRPLSPLPPNIRYNVLPSPKRELIQIKEDKYGVPQVTVRKMEKDELLVSDIEEMVVTDTEDIEVSEEEALRLGGVTEDTTSDFELPDTGTIEVSTKMTHKKQSLQVEPEEDGGSTDVEELPLTRKPRRRAKNQSKLMSEVHGEDSHTDIELLSDQDDKGKLTVRVASPGGHTDMEDFETSETEDLEAPTHEDAPTPDIIRDAAIRKMIILKEGPDGTTYTEDAHVAPARINLLGVEGESGALTDVEDIEVSGAEDDVIPDHPAVNLPEYEASSVDISEKTSIPSDSNEAKHVKDNLLLPEDNFNNLTDVESLGEGEGTHEAGQLTEQQTQSLSHEQASSGHPTSVNKAGSAQGKSKLNEADLAVLDSMMIAQEAEVEEMTFTHAQAEMQDQEESITDANVFGKTKVQRTVSPTVTLGKPHIPTQTPAFSSATGVASAADAATDTGQQLGDLTKRVADVASTMASTLESITAVAEGLEGSHLSSDEGEEQLMLMRDSPRWEDEEIQAEDTDEPRAIKAEIRLLVKTTEVGKESIEIRSIREFVECEDKNFNGPSGITQPPPVECSQFIPVDNQVYTLQRANPDVRSTSPRFVRPQQSSTEPPYSKPTHDEFDLMAQVRDVVQPDSGAGAQQAPGLGVEEISSVMESFTSDGSDPLTTTHITRIIRRTQVEDGEVKEEVQEEYEGGH